MKLRYLPAALVAIALTVPACGSSDDSQDSTSAAGTTTPAESEQSQAGSQPESKDGGRSHKRAAAPGDGGSSAADAERAAQKQEAPAAAPGGAGGESSKPAGARTPEEEIAALSPAERRRLHRDLYEQGKDLCYAYGPEELARTYNLPSTDPATLARLYARAYEAQTPSLVLPYQQGCLAGFRRHARNPPKN